MNNLPWIIFKLKDNFFAMNSSLVSGIQSLPPLTPVPEIPPVFKGVCNIRGEVIPIVDLRTLLAMSSAEADRKAVCDIVMSGKTEYAQRTEACEDWILAGRKTEPRFDVSDLLFTKWLASGGCRSAAAKTKLDTLETLRTTYIEAVKRILTHIGDDGLDREGEKLFRELREEGGRKILSVFDTALDIIDNSNSDMIITLSKDAGDQTPCLGLIVDEVHSVDQVEMIDQTKASARLYTSEHILGIAKNDKISGEIIVLDEDEILKLVKIYNDSRQQQ